MVQRGQHDVQRLVEGERAARLAGESAARWWEEIAHSADADLAARTVDESLRASLASMSRALDSDAMYLLLANETEDEVIARIGIGLAEEVTLGLGIRKGQGMAGQVLVQREPLIVDDLSAIDIVTPGLRESGLRSVVAVPLLFEERLLGVLYAGSRHLGGFTAVDADLLELMAERLASAVGRVSSLAAEREERRRAERTADRLSRLQAITSRLLTAVTAEEVATTLTQSLSVDGIGWSGIWLRQGERLELVGTGSGPSPLDAKFTGVTLDDHSALARSVRDHKPIYVQGGCGSQCSDDFLGIATGSSAAVVPLIAHDECLGVVVITHPDEQQFDREERDFLAAMVRQAFQALDRAKLYTLQAGLAKASAFLAEAAQVLAEAADFGDTLDRLAGLALGALGDICLIDVIADNGRVTRMVARHRQPSLQHLVDQLSTVPPDPAGDHPIPDVIRSGRTRWGSEMTDDFLRMTTRDDEHFALVKALGFRSYLAVPLLTAGEALGSLTLISAERPFGVDDVHFAERLAQQVAAVVGNARRYDATLRTSHILQQSLLRTGCQASRESRSTPVTCRPPGASRSAATSTTCWSCRAAGSGS